MRRSTFSLVLFALVGCDPQAVADDAETFRLDDARDVSERNGAVQLRLPKTEAEITNPAKTAWFCSGALVTSDCVVTAGHCTFMDPERTEKTMTVWHPSHAVVDEGGRPVPEEGEIVAEVEEVAVLGDNYRDLAVLRLDRDLPGPTVNLVNDYPKAGALALEVLGNGNTEKDAYGHRETSVCMSGWQKESQDPDLERRPDSEDYAYILTSRIDGNGQVNHGDSGGPVLYGGALLGVVSKQVAFTDTLAPGARKWLQAKIPEVCGVEAVPYAAPDKTRVSSCEDRIVERGAPKSDDPSDGTADVIGEPIDSALDEDATSCAFGGRSGAPWMVLLLLFGLRRRHQVG